MFPLVSDDGLLAILFPYAPCGYETALTVRIPNGRLVVSVRELWQDKDLTGQLEHDDNGQARLLIQVPGSCELMAVLFRFG